MDDTAVVPAEHREPLAEWRRTLFPVWAETRIETDRTMVTLSAAGIGLLVGLWPAGNPPHWALALGFAVALGAFGLAIVTGIRIFDRNGMHLVELAKRLPQDDSSDARLAAFDRTLRRSFMTGVIASVAVIAISGILTYF